MCALKECEANRVRQMETGRRRGHTLQCFYEAEMREGERAGRQSGVIKQ